VTSFSTSVQAASLPALGGLFLYTLWLMRTGRLSAHLTVRWMLAGGVAILGLIVWSWLPVFAFTSGLDDRELLVILAVLVFVFMAVSMLDSLARISAHTGQIKRLTQELALLRAALGDRGAVAAPVLPAVRPARPGRWRRLAARCGPLSWTTLVAVLWILCCVAFFVLEPTPGRFTTLKAGLTAGFLQ